MPGASNKARDWTQLPPELLHLITTRLPRIADILNFRTVCTKWRSSPFSQTLARQFPWLLLSPDETYPETIEFWSLSEDRVFAVPFHELRRHRIFATPHGFLVAFLSEFDEDLNFDGSVSVVNPITRKTTPLPKLSLRFPEPVSLELSLSGSTVALRFSYLNRYYLCTPGDSEWTEIDCANHVIRSTIAIWDGKFFVHNAVEEVVEVYSLKKSEKVAVVAETWGRKGHHFSTCNFVETPSGELLVVVRSPCALSKKDFELFKLEEESEGGMKAMKWAKVGAIGGYAIFFSRNRSVCLDPRSIVGCRGNCIYYVDNWESPVTVKLFGLEGGKEEAASSFRDEIRKRLCLEWITPRLC